MYKGPENSRNIVEEHRNHPRIQKVSFGLANEIERGSFVVLFHSQTETLLHLLQTHIILSDNDSVFAVDCALHYLNFFRLSADIFQTAIVLAVSTANLESVLLVLISFLV